MNRLRRRVLTRGEVFRQYGVGGLFEDDNCREDDAGEMETFLRRSRQAGEISLVVRSALRGWKVVRIQVGPELGGEDTCKAANVAREGRGFPAAGVVMKAETIRPVEIARSCELLTTELLDALKI